jgi:hypothetical protein
LMVRLRSPSILSEPFAYAQGESKDWLRSFRWRGSVESVLTRKNKAVLYSVVLW